MFTLKELKEIYSLLLAYGPAELRIKVAKMIEAAEKSA